MFIFLISIIFLSGAAMFYLILRPIKEARMMLQDEFLVKLKQSRPVFSDFNQHLFAPAVNFWKTVVLPAIYKEIEKMISRFRIHVLKIERWLLKLTNYVRGKRKIQNNGHTPYWKDINDFKNGLNGKEETDNE